MSSKVAERPALGRKREKEAGKITVKTILRSSVTEIGLPPWTAGHDRWNLELSFLITSLVLSREKIGFLEISSMRSN